MDLAIDARPGTTNDPLKFKRDLAQARATDLSKEREKQPADPADAEEEEEDADADGGASAVLLFAKHREGSLNRLFRTGHVMDEVELMTFQKTIIKKALLKQNRELDAQCVQTFKNILSYMGDRESSRFRI